MSRGRRPIHELIIAEAEDFLEHGRETEGRNRGPTVDWFLRGAERDPENAEEWCAAFCNRTSEIACAKLNILSPLELVPLQAYVDSYYQTARERGWLRDEPGFGDLFMLWHQGKGRYAHIGWVADPHLSAGLFLTVEGNSNDDGSRIGEKVCRNARPYGSGVVFANPWLEIDR